MYWLQYKCRYMSINITDRDHVIFCIAICRGLRTSHSPHKIHLLTKRTKVFLITEQLQNHSYFMTNMGTVKPKLQRSHIFVILTSHYNNIYIYNTFEVGFKCLVNHSDVLLAISSWIWFSLTYTLYLTWRTHIFAIL